MTIAIITLPVVNSNTFLLHDFFESGDFWPNPKNQKPVSHLIALIIKRGDCELAFFYVKQILDNHIQ